MTSPPSYSPYQLLVIPSEEDRPCDYALKSYLSSAVKLALQLGHSRETPNSVEDLRDRYAIPPGVDLWCPDDTVHYTDPIPGMTCFFLAAFENGLRFPLHPFIWNVLRFFRVCPSQVSPNFFGVLVGLLAFFKKNDLGVPSVPLFLELFSVKLASSEGFLYISKRAMARKIITGLSAVNQKGWKSHFFFAGGYGMENHPEDQLGSTGVPPIWSIPENLHTSPC